MNEDCLKLTTYFGEHHRTERGLVADDLLELYGRRGVEVSVLLRGIEGFGVKHHLRTDRLLTLSEDLPVVAVAVDTRARITELLDEVLAIKRHGLVTLERARMLSGTVTAIALPRDVHEAAKLTIYVGRQERIRGRPAFMAVTDLLRSAGIDGVTTLLGVDGTAHGIRRRARFFARNANVPLMIIAIGASERVGAVLPQLGGLLPRPLVTLERVRVCKRDGTLLTRPQTVARRDPSGLPVWQKLMVYSSEAGTHDDTPVHVALVRALRARGARGATSLRGIWGVHGGGAPHGDRLLQLRRRVPVVTVVIDAPERIQSVFDTVDEVTAETGLVTSELVPAAAEIQDGEPKSALSLARPHPAAPH